MINQLRSELLKAASSTFEKLGFVFPEVELQEWQAAAPFAHTARVSFAGPVRGWFQIRVSDDVAAELTANMLGMFDGTNLEIKRDALGEIANVICGNVVPALGRPEDVFDLGAPVLSSAGDDRDPPTGPPEVRIELGVEEGRAELSIFLEDGFDRKSSP